MEYVNFEQVPVSLELEMNWHRSWLVPPQRSSVISMGWLPARSLQVMVFGFRWRKTEPLLWMGKAVGEFFQH